jgi:hypothetical protein
MAIFSAVELELFPMAIGAILYVCYMALSALRRAQMRQPQKRAGHPSAAAPILAEVSQEQPKSADPAPKPSQPEEAPWPQSWLEARMLELEANVSRMTSLKRQKEKEGYKPTQLLLCLALILWGGMIFAEQVTSPAAETEDVLTAAEPSADYLMAHESLHGGGATQSQMQDLDEPDLSEASLLSPEPELTAPAVLVAHGAGPSADELAAAGYSVDPSGLVTLSLTRQQMTIQQQGEVTYHKSAYWGTVYVGSPPVPFKVVFDTGSGHLVLPSSYCHSETCRVHKRYRRSGSTSAKDIDYDGSIVRPGQPRDQITVSFGTGEVTGVFVEETVCLDSDNSSTQATSAVAKSAEDNSLEPGCMKLRMIAATAMSEEPFKTFKFDGVLGLGLDGLSQSPEFNFITSVSRQLGSPSGGLLPQMFAVFLGEHTEESEITVGGWAQKRMADDELVWRPVLDPELGHWMVGVSALYVDDQRVSFCDAGEKCKAVVDTGTSLLAVPTPSFPELFELLRHQVSDDFKCVGAGPKLHFELGGTFNLTMEPQDYARVQETKRQSPLRHREDFGAVKSEELTPQQMAYCKPMLMSLELPAPIGPKLFILGEPALRKYYTAYDAEAKRVGFARAKHEPAVPMETSEDDDTWFFEDEEQ